MKIIIVGAGQAGGWAAWALRDTGFAGEIVLVGEERHPPYQRPPLSKEVLMGVNPPESTYLWPGGLDAEFVGGVRACRIDRALRRIELSDGRTLDRKSVV